MNDTAGLRAEGRWTHASTKPLLLPPSASGEPAARAARRMFSASVSESSSTPCWNRMPARSSGGTLASQATSATVPLAAGCSPASSSAVCVLPTPELPRSHTHAPGRTSTENASLANEHVSATRRTCKRSSTPAGSRAATPSPLAAAAALAVAAGGGGGGGGGDASAVFFFWFFGILSRRQNCLKPPPPRPPAAVHEWRVNSPTSAASPFASVQQVLENSSM